MWNEIWNALIRLRTEVLCIILGAGLIVLGAAKGVQYSNSLPVNDLLGRIILILVGTGLCGFGFLLTFFSLSRTSTLGEAKKYGFKITQPKSGTRQPLFNGGFNLEGVYVMAPPIGCSVAIIEIVAQPRTFAFRRKVDLDPLNKSWHARGVWAGTKPNLEKCYAIVIVGPTSKILWNLWEKVGELHKWDPPPPPIDEWPADILFCEEVRIVTGENRI
jgi:hypothetical protein